MPYLHCISEDGLSHVLHIYETDSPIKDPDVDFKTGDVSLNGLSV